MLQLRSLRAGRAAAALALSGALAVGISACGSSSSSSSSSSSTTSGSAPTASTTGTSARYQARLNLAKCLRSHGLNVPDPSANGGAAGGAGAPPGFRSLRDQPNFQSALQACAKYRREAFAFGNISPAQRARLQQDLVKFAECMRSQNINIPDPTTGTGGAFGIFRQISPSERNSPAFQSALQHCSSTLPFRRRGTPPGGAANPGA